MGGCVAPTAGIYYCNLPDPRAVLLLYTRHRLQPMSLLLRLHPPLSLLLAPLLLLLLLLLPLPLLPPLPSPVVPPVLAQLRISPPEQTRLRRSLCRLTTLPVKRMALKIWCGIKTSRITHKTG